MRHISAILKFSMKPRLLLFVRSQQYSSATSRRPIVVPSNLTDIFVRDIPVVYETLRLSRCIVLLLAHFSDIAQSHTMDTPLSVPVYSYLRHCLTIHEFFYLFRFCLALQTLLCFYLFKRNRFTHLLASTE